MADALTPEITTDRATVYRSTWLELAATLPDAMPGASLAIVDGPYNMRKAEWDCFRDWDHFREWYRAELVELSRVLAPSANLYVWGTDTSASALREVVEGLGWTRRTRIIWDKVNDFQMISAATATTWTSPIEVADHYQRGPDPAFQNPTSCIWRHSLSATSLEQLKGGPVKTHRTNDSWICKTALHPCQKPLAFYDRLIRSSSRPGDTVLEPYGGTLRAAVACHRLPPSEARRAIVCEPDATYIEAVRPSLEWVPPTLDGLGLFG